MAGGIGDAGGDATVNGNVGSGGGGGGGAGLVQSGAGTSVNDSSGSIRGGVGGAGGSSDQDIGGGGGGGEGGAGVLLTGGGSLTNTGAGSVIAGGGGGGGGDGGSASGGDGGDGGSGVSLTAGGSVTNSGAISGGDGGDGGFIGFGNGGNGGAGGIGVSFAAGGSITNSGTITGGKGGGGTNASGPASGGNGAAGGIGVSLAAGTSITNSGTIAGGDGGGGGAGSPNLGAGDGGLGGAGIAGSGITVDNQDSISGGNGGAGGISGGVAGDGGGEGGSGVSIAAGGSVTNSGTIAGGNGGNGVSLVNFDNGGNGGAGGSGVSLTAGGSITNNGGTITGGNGGSGGTVGAGTGIGGGAAGGNGVSLIAGGSVTNSGTIAGGNGGAAEIGLTDPSGAIGLGGAGISGSGITVDNQGTISGGLSGDGTTQADAIQFTGGVNTLKLETGSVLNGAIDVTTGATATVQANANGLSLNSAVILNGAGTVDTQTNNLTLSGLISGTSALTKMGSGTLTLSGTNTYLGGTLINAGTVVVSADANLGASTAGLTLNGGSLESTAAFSTARAVTLNAGGGTFQTDTNLTASGNVSGAGALTKTGTATLTLSGANTYVGGTTISAGTLSVSADANLGVATGGLTFSGGTLQLGSSFNLAGTRAITLAAGGGAFDTNGFSTTVSQAITGAGGLTKTGAGTLTLTSANLYTGGTTINAGTLALGAGGSLSATGAVNLAASGATFDISAAGNQTIGSLAGVAGSDLVLGANLLTLSDQTDQVFDGNVSGTANLLKQGTGTQVFNGNSAGFAGTTEIAAGTFEVGDINDPGAVLGGDVTVDAAGTLRGHGTIVGDVTNNGFVMPGGTVGTLTINGNYSQASTATLTIEVNPTTGSQLKVNGAANLNGSLAILYDPGTYAATQYTILTATNGVNGRFSSVSNTVQAGANLGALQQTISYQANEVDLALTEAATPAAQIVVGPIDTSIYTALGSTLALGAQNTNAALLDRLSQPRDTGALNGWATATGAHTRVGATNGEPGFQADQYGFMTGLDHQVGNYTVGIAAGYNHADIDEQITGDSGTTDTLRAALYGNRWLGPVGVSATLGYGLDFLSQKRPFGAIGTATGDHMGQEVTAASQASLPMTFAGLTLTPSLGLRYAYVHGNAFGESGANGQDLNVGTDNVHSLQPYTEITLDKAFGNALRPVNVQFRVGYAQELLDTNRAVAVSAQDGTVFAAPGTNLPHGQLTTGLSVSMQPSKAITVSLSYDALLDTSHASAQTASLKLGYRF